VHVSTTPSTFKRRQVRVKEDMHTGSGGEAKARPRRRLLNLRGDRNAITLDKHMAWTWVKDWSRLVNMSSPACLAVVDDYESRLYEYGYSLKNFTHVHTPDKLKRWLL